MAVFLITFKPATENPNRGWPLEDLRSLISRVEHEGSKSEWWRFASFKKARVGDKVFLLVQGKLGPAIIGQGEIAEIRARDKRAQIAFGRIVDPTVETLLDKDTLRSIPDSAKIWNTQTSGIQIPLAVANKIA